MNTNTKILTPYEENEKVFIEVNLLQNNFNIRKTAKLIGLGRQTLYNKIKAYDIGLARARDYSRTLNDLL